MFKHFFIGISRTLLSALAIGAALFAVPAANAVNRFVSIYNPTPGNGLSWPAARTDLQFTIDESSASDVIFVGQGTYTRIGGTKELSFILKDGVMVIGGFAGWLPGGTPAPNPFARDVIAYESTLSGDFLGNDLPGFINRADNAYHVVVAADINIEQDSTLDGFTISGGQADNTNVDNDPFPVILRPNHRANGAGLYAINSRLNVIRCTFTDNLAAGDGGKGFGGGVYLTVDPADPIAGTERMDFINCTFHRNQATRGAALAVTRGAKIRIVDCTTDDDKDEATGAIWPHDLLHHASRGNPTE